MAIPSKPSYSHGSTGTQPGSPIDYANGDNLEANHQDYYVNTPFEKIKALIDNWHAYDSDDDGVVDAADTATNVKGNDIDSNGDGTVDEADSALAYKGTDIDSDGDGTVDAADQVNTGGTAAKIRDTTNGKDLLVANENGPVNVPVNLQEQTNRVATRNWATGGNIGLDDLATKPTPLLSYQYNQSTWTSKTCSGSPLHTTNDRNLEVTASNSGGVEQGSWVSPSIDLTDFDVVRVDWTYQIVDSGSTCYFVIGDNSACASTGADETVSYTNSSNITTENRKYESIDVSTLSGSKHVRFHAKDNATGSADQANVNAWEVFAF